MSITASTAARFRAALVPSSSSEPAAYTVLGGAGFVGSAICRELLKRGVSYRSVGRSDYSESKGSGCDVLINAAGNARRFWANANPIEDFAATVDLTMRTLMDFEFETYVLISSIDVYPRPEDPAQCDESIAIDPSSLSPYGFHKWLAEQLVRHYASKWLILRLGGLVGEGLKKNPVHDALAGEAVRLTRDSELGFIDTSVVAQALLDLLGTGVRNEVINMCGTGVVTMDELASLMPTPVRFTEPGERQLYRVGNARLRAWAHVPTSEEAIREHVSRVKLGSSGTA